MTAPRTLELCPFTRAERRVVALLAAGRTQAEIAGGHGMSQATVYRHVLRLRKAAGARNDAELVAICLRKGWIV